MLNIDFLVVILGIVLIVEGIPWFLSPQRAKRVLAQLFALDERTLRFLGLFFMLAGLGLVYIVKG